MDTTIEIKLGSVGLTRAIHSYGLSCILKMGTVYELTTVQIPAADASKFRKKSYGKAYTPAERAALQRLYSGYNTGCIVV